MKKIIPILICMILLVAPLAAHAQGGITDPIFMWSSGQIDPTDNSVFYSFMIASGPDALEGLTIVGEVPEGATFVANFWQPESSTFVGEADGTVTWQMPALEADKIAGPFTFRVTFDNAAAEDFAPVGFANGSVIWSDGTLASQAFGAEVLTPLAETGDVTIDAAGTLDFVPVGETGAWIYVPENAVSESVTLTLTRLPITEETDVPEVAEETWWCAEYALSADKEVTFSEPIVLLLPIRRALTPAQEVAVFGLSDSGEWVALSDGIAETTDGESVAAFVSRDGNVVELTLNAASFSTTPATIAIGVSTKTRATAISSSKSSACCGGDPAPWF